MYVVLNEVYVEEEELQRMKEYRKRLDRREAPQPPDEVYELLKYIETEATHTARKKGWKDYAS